MNGAIHETIRHLAHPIGELHPYSKNPRQGNVAAIAESLRINGQYRPIVAQQRTGEVLAGNHTLKAATQLGWPEIAVTWVDVNEIEAARIVAVDNRSNDLATYDDRLLAELLGSLPDLDGTGYGPDDLAKLIADVEVPDFEPEDEATPLDSTEPKRCPSCGYEWRLGPRGEPVPA